MNAKIDSRAAAEAMLQTHAAQGVRTALRRIGVSPSGDLARDVEVLLERRRVTTQVGMSELYVELAGGVDGAKSDELTDVLAAAFPQHNVGPRHGPHYLSRIRTAARRHAV